MSFLPIFVMGVLFGLAMDYEMFLVSAMREHYVVSGVPREAVKEGFRASARVVTAAALIMTSVFIAFVPGGSTTIQQIAFGLAVGVSVDAFLVRMTLVPAVLVLLDHRAWWLSTTAPSGLPEVDVEGAALHRKIAFEDYQAAHGQTTLLAQDLVVRDGAAPAEVVGRGGGGHPRRRCRTPTTRGPWPGSSSARRTPSSGELVVDGLLVPEQREAVVRRTALLELTSPDRSEGSVEDRVHDRVRLEAISGRRRRALTEQALGLVQRARRGRHPAGRRGQRRVGRGRGGARPGQRRRRVRALRARGPAGGRIVGPPNGWPRSWPGAAPPCSSSRAHRRAGRQLVTSGATADPDPRTRQRREDAP